MKANRFFKFICLLVFNLGVLSGFEGHTSDRDDVRHIVKAWAKWNAAQHNTRVDWVITDVEGVNNAQFGRAVKGRLEEQFDEVGVNWESKFLSKACSEIKWGHRQILESPNLQTIPDVHTMWFDHNSPEKDTRRIERRFERSDERTVSFKSTLSLGLPAYDYLPNLSVDVTKSKVKVSTETMVEEDTVTIPPYSSVKIQYIRENIHECIMPFACDLVLKGHVIVRYYKNLEDKSWKRQKRNRHCPTIVSIVNDLQTLNAATLRQYKIDKTVIDQFTIAGDTAKYPLKGEVNINNTSTQVKYDVFKLGTRPKTAAEEKRMKWTP